MEHSFLIQAQKHLLVLARMESLDCLADARKEHLPLLETMHAVGMKWADKFLNENAPLVFRLGYHSVSNNHNLDFALPFALIL